MQDYATGVSLMIQTVLISSSFVYRTELGPVDADRRRERKVPGHDAHAVRGREPARLPAPGIDPGRRRRSPPRTTAASRPTDRSRHADRSPARDDGSEGEPDQRHDRLVQRRGRCSTRRRTPACSRRWRRRIRIRSTLESDLYTSTQQFVNERAVDEQLRDGRRPASARRRFWVNKRLATLFPGLGFPSGAPTSNTTFVDRHLAGVAGPCAAC